MTLVRKRVPKHTQKASTGRVEHRSLIPRPLHIPQQRLFGYATATRGAPYSFPARREEGVETCCIRFVAGGTHSQMHVAASAGGGAS